MFKLKKMSLVTEHLEITNNHLPDGQFSLSPKITRNVGKLQSNVFFTQLNVDMTSETACKFPFDLHVSLRGEFEFFDIDDENDVEKFMKLQAVHILYPYLRSMVSSLTTTAMIAPLILPIVDASKLFQDDQQNTVK